jgi:small subunit ribosomal protein S8
MDRLGNLLTSIRNAELARHAMVTVPFANVSMDVLAILKKTDYITDFVAREDGSKKFIDITLAQPSTIHHYKRISKPGRRLYTSAQKIPMVLRGLGMVIVSTSKGVMTGKDAHKQKLGGELICEVY